jgi:hypothetical protein
MTAQPGTTAMTESPNVWTASLDDLSHRLGELLRFAETGGAVLLRDGRAHGREFWLTAEPPGWWARWAGVLDDSAAHTRLLRERSRSRLARALAAKAGRHA